MSNLLSLLKASLLALRFKSEAKLASSILRGDQGVKILASKMAALNMMKATEDTPASMGADNNLTTRPDPRPQSPPKSNSFTTSLRMEDMFVYFESAVAKSLLLVV